MTFCIEIEKNYKINMEIQETLNSQRNFEQKRASLEVLQYLISNYTQQSIGIKVDVKVNE
jgi:hypothetical protein